MTQLIAIDAEALRALKSGKVIRLDGFDIQYEPSILDGMAKSISAILRKLHGEQRAAWVGVAEAAKILRVSRATVYNYVKSGGAESRELNSKLQVRVEVPDGYAAPSAVPYMRPGNLPKGQRKRRRVHKATKARVFERDGYACVYCGNAEGSLVIDHVVPLSKGGSNKIENLAACCFGCNASKKDKMLEDWMDRPT